MVDADGSQLILSARISLLTAEQRCPTRGGRAVRSRRRKNAPPMVPCLFWRGRGMYGVELYAAVRLAVVDEGLSHHEAGGGSASTAGL